MIKLSNIALGLSLASVLAMAGCGNGVADDPLAGTWSNTSCFGSATKPTDIASCRSELMFSNDLEIELTATRISLAATAMYPGCTTTKMVTGQQWYVEHETDTVTITGEGASTIERTDCVNTSDNLDERPTTDISIPAGDTIYVVANNKLTVQSGALQGTYTR